MKQQTCVAIALAGATAIASLVYDSQSEAAEPKRVLGLALSIVIFAIGFVYARPPYRSRSTIAALGFVVVSALSIVWGLPCGLRDLSTWTAAIVVGFATSQLEPRASLLAVRVAALTIGTATSALAIVARARGLFGFDLHAGQGNPNWLGLLLSVCVPLSIDAVVAATKTRALRGFIACLIGVELVALYFSHSRVGWIAGGVSVIVQLVRSKRAMASVSASALVLAVIIATPAQATTPSAQSVSDDDIPASVALSGRIWIWKMSAHAALKSPIVGAGLGRFGHAYLDAQGESLSRLAPQTSARRFVNATTAHNEYLQIAAESGLVALGLFVYALALAMRDCARRNWVGGLAALVAFAICAMADSPLRQPAMGLLVGMIFGVRSSPEHQENSRRFIARGLVLAGLIVSAWLAYGSTRSWMATRARWRARDADPKMQLALLNNAMRLDPSSGEATLDLAIAEIARGNIRSSIVGLVHANELVADSGARIALASARLALGERDGAERDYRLALAWNTGSYRARVGLAETLLLQKRFAEAEEQAQIAAVLRPGDLRTEELQDRIREARMDE